MKNKSYKIILNKISYSLKIKHYDVIFRPISAYHPEDFKNFVFEGWTALKIEENFYYIKRPNTYIPWHDFEWKNIFKKNWKYRGPKKENYIMGEWYKITFDFKSKTVIVQEANTGNKRWTI